MNKKVSKLEIIGSNLKHILPDTFDSETFRATLTSLTIDNALEDERNPLIFNMLAKGSFKGLSSLSSLTIQNCPTFNVLDKAALDNLKDSLTQLKISRIPNEWQPSTLFSSSTLKKITNVDFQRTHIKSINNSSFTSIAAGVKTLNLANSKLETIAANTFAKFKVLENLFLQLNLLKTLPTDVFDNILPGSTLTIVLTSNKWVCDCELQFLQQLILDNPVTFSESASCFSPRDFQGKEIADVELCSGTQETTLIGSSTIDEETPGTEPPIATEPPSTDPPQATEPPETLPPETESPETVPPTTEAPETLPPATEAPETVPPSTEPPETLPPVSDPPETIPPTTNAPETLPPTTQPPETLPPATEPPSTNPPPVTDPPVTATTVESTTISPETTTTNLPPIQTEPPTNTTPQGEFNINSY